jgi:hypothetical protein
VSDEVRPLSEDGPKWLWRAEGHILRLLHDRYGDVDTKFTLYPLTMISKRIEQEVDIPGLYRTFVNNLRLSR